jgi:hypothetical protein
LREHALAQAADRPSCACRGERARARRAGAIGRAADACPDASASVPSDAATVMRWKRGEAARWLAPLRPG